MKRTIILIASVLVVAALTVLMFNINKNRFAVYVTQTQPVRTEPIPKTDPFDKQTGTTIRSEDGKSATYRNEEFGFELMFPVAYKDPHELWYKGAELYKVNFSKNDLEWIALAPEKTVRTCEDLLKNGSNGGETIPASCEYIDVDGTQARVVTYKQGYQNEPWKEVIFSTDKGHWSLSTGKSSGSLYTDLMDMAHSIKLLP